MDDDINTKIKETIKEVKKHIDEIIKDENIKKDDVIKNIKRLFVESAKTKGVPKHEFSQIVSFIIILLAISNPVTIR